MRKIELGTLSINQKAKKYVKQILDNNRLSYGPFLQKFERKFAKLHNSKFAIASSSGTSSLQVSLQCMKELHNWKDGDEVIVPAVTFVATSNIVIHNNMKPVFVDVDRNYYEIEPKLIEEKITEKTRCIIPVHLFGQPCDMNPIIKLTKKHDIKIIEDSCETMFACYMGKSVGSLGDIGCFSTYIAHLITTGVGGISTTDKPEYAIKIRSLLNHGRNSIYMSIDDDDNKGPKELREIIAKRFSFVSIGHSSRITEMEGALGLAQLEDWKTMISKRGRNAKYFVNGMEELEDKGYLQLPKVRPGCDHSFMMFPVVLLNEKKDNFVNYLETHNIETRDMLPLINQPVYQKLFNINLKEYPVADWINNNGFYIGCHQNLSRKDLDYVINIFYDYFKKK